MKNIYICSLSLLLAMGSFFLAPVNFSFAATACGPEPVMRDCQILYPSVPGTTENSPGYTDCGNKNRADGEAYIKCIDKEYADYMRPTMDKWEREDQRKAAEDVRYKASVACSDAALKFSGEENDRCYADCKKIQKNCQVACGAGGLCNGINLKCTRSATAQACVNACFDNSKDYNCRNTCIEPINKKYLKMISDCQDPILAEYNRKMDLIRQNKWSELQKMLDGETKSAEERKLVEEKGLLDEAKKNDPNLTTVSTTGEGLAILQADGTWKTVYAETDIKDGDLIKTRNGGVTIKYSDGSKIEIGSGSSVKYSSKKFLTNLNAEVEKTINLLKGKIRLLGKKFEIRTPNSILAVRGTEFILDYDTDAKITTVYLYEGILDVSNLKSETKELNKGETITVDNSDKMILGKFDQNKWVQLSDEISLVENPGQEEQLDTTEQGTTVQSSGKSILWLVLIGLIGFLIYFIKKTRN